MTAQTKKPRIAIYGTGQYGCHVTRLAVEKGWEIVAAFNRPGVKIGKDLGKVADIGRNIGVVIQDCETADFSTLDADIGVVATTNILDTNFTAYERLMNAQLNVICHGSQAYHPFASAPEIAEKIHELAHKNGVTFTGSGIWDMSRIWSGLLVIGPCTQIKSLFHRSITDAKGQALDAAQARQVGIGMTLKEFRESAMEKNPIAMVYTTVPTHVLERSGYSITHSATHVEPVVFDEDVDAEFLGGVLKAGTCVGTRIVGEIETREGVTATIHIEVRLIKDEESEHTFWEVDGKPKSRIRIERDDSAHATAANLFNRIPDVIAAAPGIVTVSELGPLKTTALS